MTQLSYTRAVIIKLQYANDINADSNYHHLYFELLLLLFFLPLPLLLLILLLLLPILIFLLLLLFLLPSFGPADIPLSLPRSGAARCSKIKKPDLDFLHHPLPPLNGYKAGYSCSLLSFIRTPLRFSPCLSLSLLITFHSYVIISIPKHASPHLLFFFYQSYSPSVCGPSLFL